MMMIGEVLRKFRGEAEIWLYVLSHNHATQQQEAILGFLASASQTQVEMGNKVLSSCQVMFFCARDFHFVAGHVQSLHKIDPRRRSWLKLTLKRPSLVVFGCMWDGFDTWQRARADGPEHVDLDLTVLDYGTSITQLNDAIRVTK